ncbi:colicin M resistance protein CbrA [Citrobacter amalonaticus]|uniref:Protein CbrA n=1 Tax=Citrobacter amalonaticus TaxID=35703 RepID=A0A2S4RS88_CITAM|nr:colicin M resistance lipid reductase CbrA [Citrobacter amalonaticus]POT55767.1 colicin M resistance protein CbrA [Citrobacter amalonaticus]POT73980.1 colicin M resistance protein CbrA [Citrobacter amalonaticus]POU62248.1 colicin M resistance protein CbrA [Citrobacter amalonaticus]POV02750.1 colicin M resistance protein CbrA [Citrobacter amalonaticus]
MEHFDVAIIGLGPAGAALARQLSGKMRVIALDKKHQCGNDGFTKPCGGLLAPDAQRSFIRDGITLPVEVIANPQIFSVKTVDVEASLMRNYQRSYININRHAFDLWMKSLIPEDVQVYHDSLCRKVWREEDKWHVIFRADGWEQQITARYLVGADGANSLVRRYLYPQHQIRKYVAIQQWFAEKHAVPFYSCIFDNAVTDCYSWSISKDGYFIFGGAYPMKDGQARFDALKAKMEAFHFQFAQPVKSEKCTVLFPSRWKDFVCGEENAFLIGEAAGFISASSLEGISYALDSAALLKSVLIQGAENKNSAYQKASRKLRIKLYGKIIKSRILTSAFTRKWIMQSGVAHIPLSQDRQSAATAGGLASEN